MILCVQAYGILGCFRFLAGYYFLVLTERQFVGSICGTLSSWFYALRITSSLRMGFRSRAGLSDPAVSRRNVHQLLQLLHHAQEHYEFVGTTE